jgi:hypothetical protein
VILVRKLSLPLLACQLLPPPRLVGPSPVHMLPTPNRFSGNHVGAPLMRLLALGVRQVVSPSMPPAVTTLPLAGLTRWHTL